MSEPFDLVVLGGGIVGVWTALRAHARGLRVAVVEIGPRALSEQRAAQPPLRFRHRENFGATRARNQVLTGNSAFWGGALVRNPASELAGVLGDEASSPMVARIEGRYPEVERQLGIEAPGTTPRVEELDRVEAAVLPGRRRGLWSAYAQRGEARDERLADFPESRIVGLAASGGRVESVTVEGPGGRAEISGRRFLLSMGAVDSNLFAQRFVAAHLPEGVRVEIGRRLHDHWSLPIAKVRWRNGTVLSDLFPPKFARGGIVGRRLAFAQGFFHFVADFDALPPFDRVKSFLSARQRSESVFTLAGKAIACFGRPVLMASAGFHYLRRRELRVPDGAEISLVLDFESDAAPENAIAWEGDGAVLDWDVRPGDAARFVSALSVHGPGLRATLNREGLDFEWLVPENAVGAESYLRAHAVDAYHLGGGLQARAGEGPGGTVAGGAIRGLENVQVCGTAAFARPGPANPVLTLLAMAEDWLGRVSAG